MIRKDNVKLYYLTSEHWAKVILREGRLKLSTVAELNDPFELLGAEIGEPAARKIVKYLHGSLSKRYGLVCMSSTWQSPVMWAHYGDKHKGVCLAFDVMDKGGLEVNYHPKRLALRSTRPADLTPEVLTQLFTTKSAEWSYEKEYRLIINFEHALKDGQGMHFLPFNTTALQLNEVILGFRCQWSLKEAAQHIGKVKHAVRLKRVRPSFKDFKMVQQRNEPMLHVKPRP